MEKKINSYKKIPINEVRDSSASKIVFKLLNQFRRQAIFVGILILLTALLEGISVSMFMPLVASVTGDFVNQTSAFMMKISDIVSSIPEDSRLIIFGLIFIALVSFKGLITVLQANASYRLIYAIRAHWIDHILRKYLAGSLLFMRTKSQGELVNDLVQETTRSIRAILDALNLISRAITIGLLVIIMIAVDWRITLIATSIGAGSYLLGSRIIKQYSERMGGRLLKLNRRISSEAIQALSGLREVKLYGVQGRTMNRFNKNVSESHLIQTNVQTLMQIPSPMAEILLGTILVSILAFITLILGADPIDYLPQVGLFSLAGVRVASNLSFIVQKRLHFGTFVASIHAINGIITSADVPMEIGFGSKSPKVISDGIKFKSISFSYAGEQQILKNIDLDIDAGKITALVGPSGSGKSTIVDLLAGFYIPTDGQILVNNESLNLLDLERWRSTIGYISQEPFLFSTTIRENIALGAPEATDEIIMHSARLAHAESFINSLPDGFDTILGEGGYGLSLGQRQRIAVARAIARNPSLYIFDEATSALDTETAAAIENTIRNLSKNSTVIIITHRESTAAIADRIYRIVDGRAINSGTV